MVNSLLDSFPEVELNYPKLYLGSATTLGHIFHADVYNQSRNKRDEYQKIVPYYVPSPSLSEALAVLSARHYVVISGEPGVGKSTLAGMLALYFLR